MWNLPQSEGAMWVCFRTRIYSFNDVRHPVAADCRPAIEERHKWDAARNPLPFGKLLVLLGRALRFEPLEELSSIE